MKGKTPKVLNKYRDEIPKDAVYIGRPSKWGNPYSIGKDGSREEVINKYRAYLLANEKYINPSELKGRDLVCFCSPKACHGDVLLKIANK